MDEERLEQRHFDKKSIKFQSKEPGRIIKSLRKFGIEVEMYNEKSQSLTALAKTLSRAFGIEHDGSIQAPGYALEVVSPILQGALGEQTVQDLFARINELNFKVNKSCGLHVHLDGAGFMNDGSVKVIPVAEVSAETFSKVGRGDIAFVMRREMMNEYIRATHMEPDDIAEIIAEELVAGQRNIFLSKTLGTSVPELKVRDTSIVYEKQEAVIEILEPLQQKDPPAKVELGADDTVRVIKATDTRTPKPEDYVCIVHYSKNLQNLLTLLYLHTVYADVFKAMLPPSRRSGNGFCQDVALGFSAKQLETITSYSELESAWYSEKNTKSVRQRKGDKYDDSRYFSMNLHSLFAKYGTVEMRSHSGTTDPLKALYWAALHQEIMDKIVAGEVTIDALRTGSNLFSVEEKLPVLLNVLNLRTALRKYMIQRIEYFNKK
jgi:hypothetical protein